MAFSRIGAFITAFLLIAAITLISIMVVRATGAAIMHGPGMEMEGGVITKINSSHSFVLMTDDGAIDNFQCIERCVQVQKHMQRHLIEHAHTAVYYVRMANDELYAVDVD